MTSRTAALILGALLAGALPARAQTAENESPEAAREARFTWLLRTYPERPPDVTLGETAKLVDEGPFAERDRALYWIGSARLALGDRAGARHWFERLGKEHPGSVWVERSALGFADAAAQERRYDEALRWHAQAATSRDAAVRELARIASIQVRILRLRQRAAWAAQVFAIGVALFLLVSITRRSGLRALWPPPAETRIVLPVLAVLSLLSLRQDPAPRGAILELCGAGAVLSILSGARLSAGNLSASRRLLHALLVLLAFAAWAYVAVWRGDLVGMVLETIRAGPE